MDIFVIGCGRWGGFLAWYLDRLGHRVTLYGRESSENLRRFRATRKNEYLTLPERVALTSDLRLALGAEAVVVSIASQGLAALISELGDLHIADKTFVFCMKGLEASTGRRLSEIASEGLDSSNKIAVWLGPGHVQAFTAGVPNCMVIDSVDEAIKVKLVEAFSSELIRFYYGNDIIGGEVGAAAKNVIGIAAGMLDGIGLSALKGALMSRGTREIAQLIEAMGGKSASAYGLCHLGDYEATVFSPYSHNRRFGEAAVKGEPYAELAEGFFTVRALKLLSERYAAELPICSCVYRIVHEGADPRREFEALFTRSLKKEF
ncbi:MAG: glycerol-3-phosphate dehydrogenase [Firmicutes bacterium]|nr:glycerol-3-phosphate dehydrogenase [Bacillota bacterium]